MNIDEFQDINYRSSAHRVERFLDPKTNQVGNLAREIVEFTIVCKHREEFDKLGRYFSGRKLVAVYNWEYPDGYYYVRNRKPQQVGVKYEIVMSTDYIGLEAEGRVEKDPLEFKHRVVVEENFSDAAWGSGQITTWPVDSPGVGSQYETIQWSRKSSNLFYVAAKVRPDGQSGNVLYTQNIGASAAIFARGSASWSSLKIRATIANSGSSTEKGGSLFFRFKDNNRIDEVYKEAFALSWQGTTVILYRIENNVWTEIWNQEVGLSRPTVNGNPTVDDWYELGVTLIGPIIEIYWEGEFLDYIKYDRFQVGEAGFPGQYSSGVSWFADLVVEKIHVPVYPLPAKAYQVDEFVHDAVHTKDGWVQRVLDPKHPLKFWLKPENILDGVIRMWDMRDGTFDTPLRWEEVTHEAHQFKGDMFAENGICGIWYNNGRAYYMYNGHLDNVIMGFDTSAWWSQGYNLRNIAPFKSYGSPAATKGSLFRYFRWHDDNWFLHPQEEWSQSKRIDFQMINPEIQANFLLYGVKESANYESGTRIASYDYDDPVRGARMCAPSGKLKGEFKWGNIHSLLSGKTNLVRATNYAACFSHGTDSHQLLLNGKTDEAQLSPFNSQDEVNDGLFEKVRRARVTVVGPTVTDEYTRRAVVHVEGAAWSDPQLIPLKQDADAVDMSLGAISEYIVRKRTRGQQQTLGYDAVCHYTFDKGDTDYSLAGLLTRFLDISENNNPPFRTPQSEVIAFEDGVINEGNQIIYNAIWNVPSITGHSSGHIAVSFYIKWLDNPYGEASDRQCIRIKTSGADLVDYGYDATNDAFYVKYNGTTITNDIPISLFMDNQWHSVVICGGVGDDVIHVFVDNFHWSATVSTPTLAISDIWVQNSMSTTNATYAIDEFVILDKGVPASIGAYVGSFSSLIRKRSHDSKSEFSNYSKVRWEHWNNNNVILHAKFDEGVEDIGPRGQTITTTAKYGCLKDGGFSAGGSHLFHSFDPGAPSDEIDLEEGFTLMWRGAIINNSAIIDFRTASAADSVKVEGTTEGGIIVTIETASGENKYLGQVDNGYHEFAILYNKGRCQLRVDERGRPWTVKVDTYKEDAKFLQGTQYFGGQIIADLIFVRKWLTKGWELISHEENFWRTYYSVRYDDGATDLPKPSIGLLSKQATEVRFKELSIRIEAGNPLMLMRDTRNQEKTLRICDEQSEWTNVIGNLDGRDARANESSSLAKELLHKYLYVLHQKTANGFTVLNSPDAADDVTMNISGEKFEYFTFPSCDELVVGFFNWPLWHYLREGGEATAFGGGATGEQGVYSYWTCAALDAAGHTAYWDFYSPEYGSYLVMVRNHYGNLEIRVGDSSNDDEHWFEQFTTYTNWSRPVTYCISDITVEPAKTRVTTTYYNSAEEVDYVALLPLSNGLHFPMDFIQQLLTRNS